MNQTRQKQSPLTEVKLSIHFVRPINKRAQASKDRKIIRKHMVCKRNATHVTNLRRPTLRRPSFMFSSETRNFIGSGWTGRENQFRLICLEHLLPYFVGVFVRWWYSHPKKRSCGHWPWTRIARRYLRGRRLFLTS